MTKTDPNNSKKSHAAAAKKKSSSVKYSLAGRCSNDNSDDYCPNRPKGAVLIILNKAAAMKLAMGQGTLARKQLSALTGIQGKSTIANALTKIRNEGWMAVTAQNVAITEKGIQVADKDAIQEAMRSIPTTNAQYHQTVQEQHKLKKKQVELIQVMLDGKSYPKEQVAAAIGLTMNSTFSNLLTGVKKLGIIEFDRTTIRLTDSMFPFEPRAA